MEDFGYNRRIDDVPLPFRKIFSEFSCFNTVQSAVFEDVFYSDASVVISSPTGSGKTTIFELAIVRLLMQYGECNKAFKCVYISPIKSLCQERLLNWSQKFQSFGIQCACVTGDSSDDIDFKNLNDYNIIISTPEKWDSLTRKWRENRQFVDMVKLFMIDEVHLLNEEDRGSTLEVIVSRMKTVQNSIQINDVINYHIRFVAVSATIGNIDDIAEWLGNNTKCYSFPEEIRPVQLKKLVLGFNANQNGASPFKFDLSLNYRLQSLLIEHSEGQPTLIFCSTRKSVELTAKHLTQTLNIRLTPNQSQLLTTLSAAISDVKIAETFRRGIGMHHAGLSVTTRHRIEETFRNGNLPILVATSTLAMGVNLPAHLVVVKSTKYYSNGSCCDYTATAVHQMIGRAGRPQFDTNATALILTTNEDKAKFEKMLSTVEPIESNLHRHLIEHLNAEIVLGTVTGLDVALQWLESTFLYVRAKKNPRHYGLPSNYNKDQLDKKLMELFQINLNKLMRGGMIIMDENINVSPTMTGRLMARYYVNFETMMMFTQISGSEVFIQILAILSKCQEFSEVRLRVNDKKTLNLLNKNSKKQTIRFPLNGKIKTWDMKINCIIQAVLGNMEISDISIQTESYKILRNAQRIIKCLIDYLGMRRRNCYSALSNAILLGKCLNAKLWENSPFVSKQLSGVGSTFAAQLVNAGKDTFDKIRDSNARDIEMIIKRKPPFGDYLLDEVKHLPKFSMNLEKITSGLSLTIVLINGDDLSRKSTVDISSQMILIVGNNHNEVLMYEKFEISYLIENSKLTKSISVRENNVDHIEAHFISEDWVGIDCSCELVSGKEKKSDTSVQKLSKSDTVPSKNNKVMQTFLDIYMKIKKPEKAKKIGIAKQKSSKLEEKNRETVKEKPEIINKNHELNEGINDETENAKNSVDSKEITFSNKEFPVPAVTNRNLAEQAYEDQKPTAEINFSPPKNQPLMMNDRELITENQLHPEKIDFSEEHRLLNDSGIESFKIDSKLFESADEYLSSINFSEESTAYTRLSTVSNNNSHLQNNIMNDIKSESSSTVQIEKNNDCVNVEKYPEHFLTNDHVSVNWNNEIVLQNPLTAAKPTENDVDSLVIDSGNESLTENRLSSYSITNKYLTDQIGELGGHLRGMRSGRGRTLGSGARVMSLRNILNCRGKKKKKMMDLHPTAELEDRKSQKACEYIDFFKKPSKKRMTHDCIDDDHLLEMKKRRGHLDTDDFCTTECKEEDFELEEEENRDQHQHQQKGIKWRSPLIVASPGRKFSPKIDFGRPGHFDSFTQPTPLSRNPTNKQCNIKRTSSLKSRLPLSDRDYELQTFSDKDYNKLQTFSDICSAQFLDFKSNNRNTNHMNYYSPPSMEDTPLFNNNSALLLHNKHLLQPNSAHSMRDSHPKRTSPAHLMRDSHPKRTSPAHLMRDSHPIHTSTASLMRSSRMFRSNTTHLVRDFQPSDYDTPLVGRATSEKASFTRRKGPDPVRTIHYSRYVQPLREEFHGGVEVGGVNGRGLKRWEHKNDEGGYEIGLTTQPQHSQQIKYQDISPSHYIAPPHHFSSMTPSFLQDSRYASRNPPHHARGVSYHSTHIFPHNPPVLEETPNYRRYLHHDEQENINEEFSMDKYWNTTDGDE